MSNTIDLTESQRVMVERMGVFNEKNGMPPAPSRIVALLMISPEVELTFDQIRETLNLSKSATSNAINLLLNSGKVEYITKPGDRKRYFKSRIDRWRDDIKEKFHEMKAFADLMEEVLKQRPGTTARFNQNIRDVIDFVQFINEKLPGLYCEWEESRS